MKKITVILIAAVLTGPVGAQEKGAKYPKMAPIEQYLMADRDAEIALALKQARFLVLREKEFWRT
jgi:hypothetical protein